MKRKWWQVILDVILFVPVCLFVGIALGVILLISDIWKLCIKIRKYYENLQRKYHA